MDKPAVIIDKGICFTKIGYAGNVEPDIVIPTAISDLDKKSTLGILMKTKTDEYDYFIGE